MDNFLAHTDETRQKMLEEIGLGGIDELFSLIPSEAKADFKWGKGISEQKAQSELKKLSGKNHSDLLCFLGGGVYNHFIPAAIAEITRRFEFITAYTPYQPEISQGTLQAIYEFQSMICELTGMEAANASVYDGATACAEAVLLSVKVKRKNKVLISDALNPEYKKVVETYCYASGIEIDYVKLKNLKTEFQDEKVSDYAAFLLQMPNYYGVLEDVDAISQKVSDTIFIVCHEPSSLALLKPPSEYGADVVVGDFQSLGIAMNAGGPHGGFMAARGSYIRQLPGRIVGMTLDKEGKRAFTLTLQAREQHIRREKATSNICTNHALMALSATLYMSLTGFKGMEEVASISAQRAHKLADELAKIDGIELLSKDFLNEFVIKTGKKADLVLAELKKSNIAGGIKLSDNELLIALTEMNEPEHIDLYVREMKKIF